MLVELVQPQYNFAKIYFEKYPLEAHWMLEWHFQNMEKFRRCAGFGVRLLNQFVKIIMVKEQTLSIIKPDA